MTIENLVKLGRLPTNVPLDGSVGIEIEEGILILKASITIQNRINELLAKQQDNALSTEEEQELDCYEEIDDYLSLVNRTMRNMTLTGTPQIS
jgi:uncharacterized protein YnzC (UPF0291/DUF896 family)